MCYCECQAISRSCLTFMWLFHWSPTLTSVNPACIKKMKVQPSQRGAARRDIAFAIKEGGRNYPYTVENLAEETGLHPDDVAYELENCPEYFVKVEAYMLIADPKWGISSQQLRSKQWLRRQQRSKTRASSAMWRCFQRITRCFERWRKRISGPWRDNCRSLSEKSMQRWKNLLRCNHCEWASFECSMSAHSLPHWTSPAICGASFFGVGSLWVWRSLEHRKPY